MKKHILFIAAVLATTPVLAENDSCESVYNFAEVAMSLRQSGASLVEVKKDIRKMTLPHEGVAADAARAVMMAILEEAYETPRFLTEKNQLQTIQDYANEKALACYKRNR